MAKVLSLNFRPFWVVTYSLWPIKGVPAHVPTPTGPPMAKTSAKPVTRHVAVEESTCINWFLPPAMPL